MQSWWLICILSDPSKVPDAPKHLKCLIPGRWQEECADPIPDLIHKDNTPVRVSWTCWKNRKEGILNRKAPWILRVRMAADMGDQLCKHSTKMMNVPNTWNQDGSATKDNLKQLAGANFILSEGIRSQKEGKEDDLSEWLYKFCGKSSCHIIKGAYCLRAIFPLGQSNLAGGRGLIYKQSNLILSVWTDCNLMLGRNLSNSFVVLADNYAALSCLPLNHVAHTCSADLFSFSL